MGVYRYDLTVKVVESSSTAIQMARFNNEVIETVEGTTISAVLPVQGTNLAEVRVILYTDKADHVKSISGFEKNGNSAEFIDGMDSWVSYDNVVSASNKYTIDLSKDRIVTVTAENGKTQTYTLSASLAETKQEATLKSIYLRDENGKSYQGTVSNNQIVFNNIPYMTLNVDNWDILYTADSQNTTVKVENTAVISGQTKASVLGFVGTLSTEKDTNKAPKQIVAENKNDAKVNTKYDVIINLGETTRDGKTLQDMEISLQNENPDASGTKNAEVWDRVNAYSTLKATETLTIETGKDQKDNTGTITLKPANSLYGNGTWTDIWGDELYRILTEVETDGVAFLAVDQVNYNHAVVVSDLADDLNDFTSANNITALAKAYPSNSLVLVVLPEEVARQVLANGEVISGGTNYGLSINEATQATAGTVYSIKVEPQDALSTGVIENISVKGTALTIENDTDLVGTLPYAATVEDKDEADGGDYIYVDFEVSPHARIKVPYTDGYDYWLRDGGDTNGDGVANDPRNDNLKVLFVREANHKISVYISNSGKGNEFTAPADKIEVVAEDGTSTATYNFNKVKWAEPNTDALITAFSIDGYTGAIDGEQITVTLPYGTDLKGLVPEFTTSTNATVTAGGVKVISGQTFVNFSHPVELLVTAEDEQHTKPYTVTVKLDEAFKDVKPTDWFFDDVMQAARTGIVKGKGDGIFAPKDNVTRRDFAIMLCRVLGVDVEGTAVVPFVDVREDDYGIVAIAYCASHGIVNGYEDTTFRPNDPISRRKLPR